MKTNLQHVDIVCFSHLRWDFVTQRPQHLLREAANQQRVFYWEEPVWHGANEALPASVVSGMYLERHATEGRIVVLRPHLRWGIDFATGVRALLDEFLLSEDVTNYLSWYYTPMAYVFSQHLRPVLTVYDCMDELSNFSGAPQELQTREKELLAAADVVFTGGRSLYEAKRQHHTAVYAFPSSVDVAHFATAKHTIDLPMDQKVIPEPRVGFYGVIDERLDLGLLGTLARLRPEMNFVVIGPVVKIDPASLPQAENLHYLGGKGYAELPAYLAGWSAAMLPFALNDATRFISPTKTPEYLASGRAVVSTAIRDVITDYGDAGLVSIAADADDFAAKLDQATAPQSTAWWGQVEKKLEASSWQSTWTAMAMIIEKRIAAAEGRVPLLRSTKSVDSLIMLRSTGGERVNRSTSQVSPTQRGAIRGKEHFDYLVVGAGFAGSVLAERLATQAGKRVLVVDKREHIAGNAYDYYNEDGILVHRYGPHIFHTNSDLVVNYLSQFTEWWKYEHRVLSQVDGQLLPVPINLTTINTLYGLNLDAAGMQTFLAERVVQNAAIRTSEDIVLSRVGRELYEKFFRNYTRKQWGLDPSELDAAVAGRIPVRYDTDDRYFADTFQAMPSEGYTRMFERMLDQRGITTRVGVDFNDVKRTYPDARVIYTGPIDEYFSFKFGPLPYRSLEFRHETHDVERFQPAAVVNYPNEHAYTRITEFKYLTGQTNAKTSIVYEYPRSTGDPYYPIPRPENAALLERYKALAARTDDVTFCGRLANYKYFNMDQVVAQALTTYNQLAKEEARVPVQVAATVSVSSLTGESKLA